MNIGLTFSLIFALIYAFQAQAQKTCEIQQTADSYGNDRILKIDFPDGRRFTIVGHDHGSREDMLKMSGLPHSPQLFAETRKLVHKYDAQTALRFFREDKEILRQAVKEGAQFVGMEMANQSIAGWRSSIGAFRDRLLVHSGATGVSDTQLISDATLALQGAPMAMEIEEPGLFKNAKIIGYEDHKAGMADYALYPQWEADRKATLKAIGNDKNARRIFGDAEDEFRFLTYANYDPARPGIDAQITSEFVAKFPVQYHEVMRTHIAFKLKWAKTLFERDRLSTRNMLAQNKSGIAFMGAMHAPQIMRRLKTACLASRRPVNASRQSIGQPLNLAPPTLR